MLEIEELRIFSPEVPEEISLHIFQYRLLCKVYKLHLGKNLISVIVWEKVSIIPSNNLYWQ